MSTEEFITRREFDAFKKQVEQMTEPMRAINVNVASEDVLKRLESMDKKLDRIDQKQDEHAKGLLMHSRNISAFQTRFDKIEATMATKEDLEASKREIIDAIRKISQPGGNGH